MYSVRCTYIPNRQRNRIKTIQQRKHSLIPIIHKKFDYVPLTRNVVGKGHDQCDFIMIKSCKFIHNGKNMFCIWSEPDQDHIVCITFFAKCQAHWRQ